MCVAVCEFVRACVCESGGCFLMCLCSCVSMFVCLCLFVCVCVFACLRVFPFMFVGLYVRSRE